MALFNLRDLNLNQPHPGSPILEGAMAFGSNKHLGIVILLICGGNHCYYSFSISVGVMEGVQGPSVPPIATQPRWVLDFQALHH
jgi:hypothetical protein